MNIGTYERTLTVEPLQLPEPLPQIPAPAEPKVVPQETPVEEPAGV